MHSRHGDHWHRGMNRRVQRRIRPQLLGLGLAERVKFLWDLLVAPNGGILPFWPTAACLLVAVGASGVALLPRGAPASHWWPAVGLTATLLAVLDLTSELDRAVRRRRLGSTAHRPWVPLTGPRLSVHHE